MILRNFEAIWPRHFRDLGQPWISASMAYQPQIFKKCHFFFSYRFLLTSPIRPWSLFYQFWPPSWDLLTTKIIEATEVKGKRGQQQNFLMKNIFRNDLIIQYRIFILNRGCYATAAENSRPGHSYKMLKPNDLKISQNHQLIQTKKKC